MLSIDFAHAHEGSWMAAMTSSYDVARLRAQVPALADGTAYFDGPGGTQVPAAVADAMSDCLRAGLSNRGTVTASERRAEAIVTGARAAMADLLGADPAGIVFGRSMTELTFSFARTLAQGWGPGDQVVVTRLDHDGNVRPWVTYAERSGATVRWIDFDRATCELDMAQLAATVNERTRLVAVTGASNLLGTRPDIPAVTAIVHAQSPALAYVDGVHLTPHTAIDVAALGADLYACSPYKFLGPHCGVVAGAPALLEELMPDKLKPSTMAVPERFELGTLPYELLAGVTAAVDVHAGLVAGEGTRRDRILTSMRALEAYEDDLHHRMRSGLESIAGVTLYNHAKMRTPTELFSVAGIDPRNVYESLATRQVNAPAGSFYAIEAAEWLGLGASGAVRAGLAPYSDVSDVDRLLEGVAALASGSIGG